MWNYGGVGEWFHCMESWGGEWFLSVELWNCGGAGERFCTV